MNTAFADTFYYLALLNAADEQHSRAVDLTGRFAGTDCISFVVMERQGITEALTADHHFEQAGFVALMKDK